jgi:hypothetical protein
MDREVAAKAMTNISVWLNSINFNVVSDSFFGLLQPVLFVLICFFSYFPLVTILISKPR